MGTVPRCCKAVRDCPLLGSWKLPCFCGILKGASGGWVMLKIPERTKTEKALYLCTLISLLIDLVISWAGYSDTLFGTISSSILAVFILLLLLVLNKKRQAEPMKKSSLKFVISFCVLVFYYLKYLEKVSYL